MTERERAAGMDAAQVDQVVGTVAAAQGRWAAAGVQERAGWLRAVADRLDAHVDELVDLAQDETDLGRQRLRGEVARTTGQLRLFADVVTEGSYLEATIDHADPAATPPRPDLRRMLRPVGLVAVYAASNFPFAFSVAGGDTASALAVGCAVVVKAHPGHPRLARRTVAVVQEALHDAGAPADAVGLVEGLDAGVTLVDHPLVRAVGFTGSVAGGRFLHDRAAARPDPVPFHGELGSLNPVVVTRAADASRGPELAAGLAGSFQLGAGQFCTKPGVVLVPRASRLRESLPQHVVPVVHRLLSDRIAGGFADGLARVQAVPGVQTVAQATGEHAPATVLAVGATALVEHADRLLDEVFGPMTLLVEYRDDVEVVEVLTRLGGTLTATVHAEVDEDLSGLLPVVERIAGRVLFEGWPTGVAVGWAQHHGGPWPASTSSHTSVGAGAVRRWLRPIAYQDAPEQVLPAALRDANPLGVPRRVDGAVEAVAGRR